MPLKKDYLSAIRIKKEDTGSGVYLRGTRCKEKERRVEAHLDGTTTGQLLVPPGSQTLGDATLQSYIHRLKINTSYVRRSLRKASNEEAKVSSSIFSS